MNNEWDKSFETGHTELDSQHRKLFELLGELKNDSKSSDIINILDEVMSLTIEHFSAEEKLMNEFDYPLDSKEAMIEQHKKFESYVRLSIIEFQNQRISSVQLVKPFIMMFLLDHEFGMDRELARWIRHKDERNRIA